MEKIRRLVGLTIGALPFYLFFTLSSYSIFVFLLSGCDFSKNKTSDLPPSLYPLPLIGLHSDTNNLLNQARDSNNSLVNSRGIFKSPIPIPVKGKYIDVSTLEKKKIIPAYWSLVGTYDHNVFPVPKNPKSIPVDETKLQKFIVGEDTSAYVLVGPNDDTIPTGVPIPVIIKEVPCRMPPRLEAPPMSVNSESRYLLKYLDSYHGLKASQNNNLLIDRRGNLWIVSFEGISCYDGKSIYHFTEKEGLLKNSVFFIMEDSKGNIWIDYGEGQVSKYDGNNFIHFTGNKEGSVVFRGNSPIIEDKKGNIWFINLIDGLTRYDGKYFTHFTRKEGLSSNEVRCMMEDSKGNLWIGTHGGGVSRYDGKTFTWIKKKDGLNHDIVSAIIEDKNGRIWFGTASGLARYDGKEMIQFMEADGLSHNSITSALEDKQGNLWFGTYGNGVTVYDGQTFTHITEEEGLVGKLIFDLFLDSLGNVWICSDKSISLIEPGNFRRINYLIPKATSIKTIIQNDKGNLVVGCVEGVFQFDNRRIFRLMDRDSLTKNNVGRITLLEDRNGTLWIGTYSNGLLRFDGKQLEQFQAKQGLNGSQIHALLEDHEGKIWIGTEEGLTILQGGNIVHFTEKEGLPHRYVTALLNDKKYNIWIGTIRGTTRFDGTLTRFDGHSFTHYIENGLGDNLVKNILEDHRSNLWFSTNEGIIRFDGKNFIRISEREGIPSKITGAIRKDSEGNIWFLSSKGLSEIKVGYANDSTMLNLRKLQTKEPGIINYGLRDGLKSGFGVLYLDRKNQLWLAENFGIPSLLKLDLSLYRSDRSIPVVGLKDININGKFIDFRNLQEEIKNNIKFTNILPFYNIPQNLKLSHHLNQLTFHFSATSKGLTESILYSYKMEGLGDNWSLPSTDGKAFYQYLPSGKYTFKVSAVGRQQIWSDPSEYGFVVLPPWWQTGWAYSFYIVSIGLLIRTFIRYRSRQLIKENINLEVKIHQRTNELNSSLDELKVTQRQLIQREKMASLGELTSGIAHEIQNPLNFVNNFSEINKELLEELKGQRSRVKGERNEDLESEILNDITENETKINQHGKRADAIVKGMLQHAVKSTGIETLTDINLLCDEYIRIALKGFKSKYWNSKISIETKFQTDLPNIKVIPQDISRVVMNILNNALFYVNEKASRSNPEFQPKVTVSTRLENNQILISILDNGPGIPEVDRDKIFQPFFTTKPTGQGTGLGLSLAYDIIRAYGGEINVITKLDEGSEFIVHLPIKTEQ